MCAPDRACGGNVFVLRGAALGGLYNKSMVSTGSSAGGCINGRLFLVPTVHNCKRARANVATACLGLIITCRVMAGRSSAACSSVPTAGAIPVASSDSSGNGLFRRNGTCAFAVVFSIGSIGRIGLNTSTVS